jgi:hypothetical protein
LIAPIIWGFLRSHSGRADRDDGQACAAATLAQSKANLGQGFGSCA